MKESLILESNGLKIHYDLYLDARIKAHKGLIQIAHGMIEHRGKYEYIAKKLAHNGYIVAVSDHRGHGDSINCQNPPNAIHSHAIQPNIESQEPIYLGEMGKNGFEMALSDLYHLHNALKMRFKPKRYILIGHSMGSLIARRFLQDYANCLDGLIICGSPSHTRFISLGIFMLKTLRFFGAENLAKNLANALTFGFFNLKYAKNDRLNDGKNSGIAWTNRDERELKARLNDPKCRFTFTLNSFICLFCGMRRVFSAYRGVKKPTLPILFISGEDDACGGFGSGTLRAFKHLVAQGYECAKIIFYAKARHELFLELNRDEIISDLIAWLERDL